jgi:pyruvate,water dikinase
LVAPSTDPGWIFLMLSSRGLVVEQGSLLSHAAVVGRELGIPTVVGVAGATRLIPQGGLLTLDGASGEVSWS